MRVPEQAALGSAKVTLSFKAWKAAEVKSVTANVPVVAAPKAKDEH